MFRRTGLTNIEPIELDIHFSEGFSATDIVHLVVELLKTLLLQRHQIPFPIDRVNTIKFSVINSANLELLHKLYR